MVTSECHQAGKPFTERNDLFRFLELDGSRAAPYDIPDGASFSLLVPRSFASRMRKRDWFDPLLLQVLPRTEEIAEREGFVDDPVHDAESSVARGVLAEVLREGTPPGKQPLLPSLPLLLPPEQWPGGMQRAGSA